MRIYNLADLDCYRIGKKSVIVPSRWKKPIPAAVLINMPGALLLQLFVEGVYVYER